MENLDMQPRPKMRHRGCQEVPWLPWLPLHSSLLVLMRMSGLVKCLVETQRKKKTRREGAPVVSIMRDIERKGVVLLPNKVIERKRRGKRNIIEKVVSFLDPEQQEEDC